MGEDRLFDFAATGNAGEMAAALAAGANLNAVNAEGHTPLMVAAIHGNAQTVDQLIQAGASIFSTDPAGHTPLILAARRCHTEVVRVLIQHSCRIHPRSAPSVVSLYTANGLDAGCSEVAHLLRSNPV